jgi:hypothetical protein
MIMNPERSNYEIWLIDYFDGSLDKDQVGQLMEFLDQNPDIKEQLSDNFPHNLKPAGETYRNKNTLKKSFSDLAGEQFELLCISASEHDLPEEQISDLEKMIEGNPEKRRIFDFYKKAVLVAPEVKFRNKYSLRKLTVTQKIIRLSVIGLSAAAGIAVLITFSGTPVKKEVIDVPLTAAVIRSDPGKAEGTFSLPSSKRMVAEEKHPSMGEFVKESPALKGEFAEEKSDSKLEIKRYNIAKLDFKQEVPLVPEIQLTIRTLNLREIQSPVINATPGLNGLIAKLFREKILRSGTPESGSIKGYEIADAGIIGLNKLFGWQMSLKQTRNQEGELTSLYFSSRMLKFNAPVKKNTIGT